MQIFVRQIEKIMEEFGLKKPIDFDRRAGLQNKTARWLNEKFQPQSVEIDTLLSIRKAFNKSLDWLLFAIEPSISMQEHRPEGYEARIPAEIDTRILAEIAQDAQTYLLNTRLKISASRQLKWVALLFEYWFTERSKPDKLILKKYLDMTHD